MATANLVVGTGKSVRIAGNTGGNVDKAAATTATLPAHETARLIRQGVGAAE